MISLYKITHKVDTAVVGLWSCGLDYGTLDRYRGLVPRLWYIQMEDRETQAHMESFMHNESGIRAIEPLVTTSGFAASAWMSRQSNAREHAWSRLWSRVWERVLTQVPTWVECRVKHRMPSADWPHGWTPMLELVRGYLWRNPSTLADRV